jgi:competence protein ComEC
MGGLISEFLFYTMAAQLTTWPLTTIYFQRFSLLSFLTNPMILPLQPGLMILSGVTTILGAIWQPLGRMLALLAWPLSALTIRIVTFMSLYAMSGLGLTGASFWFVTLYYNLLLGTTVILRFGNTSGHLKSILDHINLVIQARAAWVLAACALVTCFVWQSAAHAPDGLLHITFFEVGEGDAVFIQSPTGQRVLVDGGNSPTKLMNHLGMELPLIQRGLSWLALGGTRTDQTAGLLGLVDHLRIDNALVPAVQGSYSFQQLKEEIAAAGIRSHEALPGQRLDLGKGAVLEIIDCTESGLV